MRRLTRRWVVTVAAAAVVAAGLVAAGGSPPLTQDAQAAAAGIWNHDPLSPIGPARWAAIGWPLCGSGSRQSPIDIRTANVGVRGGPALMLKSHKSEVAVENTGHVVEVPIPAGVQDVLRSGGDAYRLSQYHFHAPSEHAINGRRADVEAHLVFQSDAGATAVVAAVYRVGPKPKRAARPAAPGSAGEQAGGTGAQVTDGEEALLATMVFTSLALVQLARALAGRSFSEPIWRTGLRGNPVLVGMLAAALVLRLAAVYLPFAHEIFGTTALTLGQLAFGAGLALGILVLMEIDRALRRRSRGGAPKRRELAAGLV